MNLQRVFLILLAAVLLPGLAMAQTSSRATFMVEKDFDDGNEASVQVHISCNTGLPLEQTKSIDDEDGVEFVVTDFDSGQLDCKIWETPVLGYSVYYDADCETRQGNCYDINEAHGMMPPTGGGSDDDDDYSEDPADWGCYFENFSDGDTYAHCYIDNDLEEVEVEVTKVWFDDHEEFNNSTYARAKWACDGTASFEDDDDDNDKPDHYCGYDECGSLHFEGSVDDDSFYVYPDWENGTYCHVSESTYDSGVEADDSDCYDLTLWPGIGAECTIENTRFYEGIPTLNQYGLAIMALLMLGLGFVGFRRFV